MEPSWFETHIYVERTDAGEINLDRRVMETIRKVRAESH